MRETNEADEFAEEMRRPIESVLFKRPSISYDGIARQLNLWKIPTYEGKEWTRTQVYRICKRLGIKKKKDSRGGIRPNKRMK